MLPPGALSSWGSLGCVPRGGRLGLYWVALAPAERMGEVAAWLQVREGGREGEGGGVCKGPGSGISKASL